LDARLTSLPRKKITVAKSKEEKTESNLAEYSKEDYGSERAILPMLMMISKKARYQRENKEESITE
jgi:hypothetical protein